jgi:hypothetical protein
MTSTDSGFEVTAIGSGSLASNTSGPNNLGIGAATLVSNVTGQHNIAIGVNSLESNVSGRENIAIGSSSANLNVTGNNNVSIGYFASAFNVAGSNNLAIGYQALYRNAVSNNFSIGTFSLFNNTTGINTAIGESSLRNVTTGTANLAIGSQSGRSYTSESNNLVINNLGALGDSRTIRIGTDGTHTSCYISGISGVTSAGGAAVVCNSAGQLGTVVSSRRFKRDIVDAKNYDDIDGLRVRNFKYISNGEDAPIEVGLIAEEVEEVLPELVIRETDGTPMTVNYNSLISILLKRNQKIRRELNGLRPTMEAMRSMIISVV